MGTSTEQREQTVNSAISEISHIATLPEITLKIIELVEDPKSTAQDLHDVIAVDPALSSRILKVVNSSFYGLPGQIASINRAIVMLGLNAVKNIAIAASLAKLFRGGDLTPQFSARMLWQHSIEVAGIMKTLAQRLKYGVADEAFLAGLMHDIGAMVEMQYDRNKLIDVVARVGPNKDGVPGTDWLEAEDSVFGATHQDFGMGLCAKWRFPRMFQYPVGYHHRPLDVPPEQRAIACMCYVADRLAAEAGSRFRMDLMDVSMAKDVMDELKLADSALEQLRKDLPDILADGAAMMEG